MLPHLLRRLTVSAITALAAALSVGLVAAGVRVLPWIASPSVPAPVILVFVRVLALATAEVCLLLAVPIGLALETWRLTADHSVRTLLSIGVRPWTLAAHSAAVAAALALVSAGVSSSWGTELQAPGTLSNRLLQAGRDVCASRQPASVPMVGVTWLCVAGRARLLGVTGHPPSQVAWSASNASFASDLSSASVWELRAALRSGKAQLRVERANVTGFAPWLAPGAGNRVSRPLVFAIVLLLSSVVASWCLVRWPARSRLVAFVVGTAGPVGFLLLAQRLLASSLLSCIGGAIAVAVLLPVTTRLVFRSPGLSARAAGGS